jgi:capsular polysaccharide export protein
VWVSLLSLDRKWLPASGALLALPETTLLRFPELPAMLAAWRVGPLSLTMARADGFAGWGRKKPARLAAAIARKLGRPFWTLEDGFLRSVGLGKAGSPAVSFVIDDLGVYYDASRPSRLEALLCGDEPATLQAEARALTARIVAERLTKYNHLPDRPVGLPRDGRRNLLLVDQVAGDYSVPGALADAGSFQRMLKDALAEPEARVVLRAHPDAMAGRARGYFDAALRDARLVICDAPASPHALLDAADEVWTVSSQLGFEALLRGLPVRCYGAPFYAGWGLTQDRPTGAAGEAALARRQAARAGRPLAIDDLAAAALLMYPLYYDPVSRRRVGAHEALDRLAAGRAHAEAWRGETVCAGVGWRKRRVLRAYCAPPGGRVRFSGVEAACDRIVVWGTRGEEAPGPARARGAPVVRAEDGFIRSLGLGAAKIFPLSLCFDRTGIYYDATRPSDLETMLETAQFPAEELARAAHLRQRIVAAGISKYNLAGMAPAAPAAAAGKRVAVVFGQVPDDESIRLGGGEPMSNLALLARVRAERPQAYLVFKEHPDLLAGKRRGATDLTQAAGIADEVATTGDALHWIGQADEVHVRTSLAGFEALLRGKQVHCHGLPFYAGWGLTVDRVTTPRRSRKLQLDELAAAALLRYPTYLDPASGMVMSAEDALDLIERDRRVKDARSGGRRDGV